MKNAMRASLILAAGLVVLPPGAGAQQRESRRSGRPDVIAERLFPPELVMSNQNAIGLSAEQKTAIRAAMQQAQMRFSEAQWQLQDATEVLISLLDQEHTDEAATMKQLDAVLDAEREVKRTQLTLMVRIKNELTPGQRAQLNELRGRTGRE